MKKPMAALIVSAITLVTISSAQNLDNSRYPPGVSADNWISMGTSAGFVVTSGDSQGSDRAMGTVKGYFVLRRGGVWVRVDTSAP